MRLVDTRIYDKKGLTFLYISTLGKQHALQITFHTGTDFNELLCAYPAHIFPIDAYIGLVHRLDFDIRPNLRCSRTTACEQTYHSNDSCNGKQTDRRSGYTATTGRWYICLDNRRQATAFAGVIGVHG